MSEGKIRKCPKDMDWSKGAWEVRRCTDTSRYSVQRQLEDDVIAPSAKLGER